jgi:hypothetical protein
MNDEMYGYFSKYEIVRFPVSLPPSLESYSMEDKIPFDKMMENMNLYAEISAMKVMSADGIRLILIARNDETALLMRNTFLPGQTKELNYVKTQAFYQGMIKAIKQIKNK